MPVLREVHRLIAPGARRLITYRLAAFVLVTLEKPFRAIG